MRHLVMFHGTDTSRMTSILRDGFDADPAERLSSLMSAGEAGHAVSFPGTYVAASRDVAESYAREAARRFGGDPAVFALRVPLADLVPDEDEILCAIGWPICLALGYDDAKVEDRGDHEWHPALPALDVAAAVAVLSDFMGLPETAVAGAAACLAELAGPVAGEGWDGDFRIFHPEHANGEGWSSPEWVRRLTATTEGMVHYRTWMDRLALAMAGCDPEGYPCGFDSCKGRVLRIGDATGGARIVAAGTPDDWTAFVDATDVLDGTEEWDGRSMDDVGYARPRVGIAA